ncbi:glutathione peroxidase [endosymbiont of unidentified scaly snail isolate Monju]|uniref:glutathione peroxidase n=1 Tax=endosymbiont of unidentified scaly snail isolate Monju TaxID=1248727 RepID=UPI00038922E9|nr:glutathione peroxidase [endosymbiont of unidentified scaly snail isolate Monju]BAN68302.1 glutaredoxin family protein [endosymbiont of unidentified scaly snail isolate Monju]
MQNREGQTVPSVVFHTRENGEWKDIHSDEIFKGRTVVLFALPGAFTPTCSSGHLPRYNELAPVFRENGVDEIVCLSVNDAFVMEAWKKDLEAENVTLIPDGNGEFTAGMGMLVDKSDLGFGKRSWRYAMLVRDGVIEKMLIEPDVPGDPFEISDADTMLNYINPNARKPRPISLMTKPGCPFCARAKAMLKERGMPYEEIVLGRDATIRSVRAITGRETVPQMFVDGHYIGGSEELEAWLAEQASQAA